MVRGFGGISVHMIALNAFSWMAICAGVVSTWYLWRAKRYRKNRGILSLFLSPLSYSRKQYNPEGYEDLHRSIVWMFIAFGLGCVCAIVMVWGSTSR